MSVHPSLILRVDFDGRVYSEEVKAEVRRCFSHVAMSTMSTHDAADSAPENLLTLVMKLHRPYWDAADPEAEENWRETVLRWLQNITDKVSVTLRGMERIRNEEGKDPLRFGWIGYDLKNAVAMMVAAPDLGADDQAVARLDALRTLMNKGVLPEGVQVWMPSRASLDEQLRAHGCLGRDDSEEEEEAEAVETEEGTPEPEPAEAEEPKPEEEGQEEPAADEEPAIPPSVLPAPFALDYRLWDVQFPDGTVREFDSEQSAFVAEA